MRRAVAIILWTLAFGIILTIAAGFLAGVASFSSSFFAMDHSFSPRPLQIVAIFFIGSVAGLILGVSGRLPGTRGMIK